jgi:hypothetical protein
MSIEELHCLTKQDQDLVQGIKESMRSGLAMAALSTRVSTSYNNVVYIHHLIIYHLSKEMIL